MIFSTILFYVLALVLVVAAFRVITASSPVTGVLHLILAFFTASMIWMLQGAEFLSLLLVLVYVGAVMVLFLFVVMMLDVRMDALRAGMKTYLPMGLIIGLVMVLEMAFVLAKSWLEAGPKAVIADDVDNTHALGVAMYTDYVFAVQIGGVILLVGMISAIALTLRKRADVKRTIPSEQIKVRAQDRLRMVSIPSQTEAAPVAGDAAAPGEKQ
ncbi:NADH-quinone oxidoreductase subunit J [Pusillimonas sp. MFBS29]|uniref:NADH-quinone oxidoreductase subunit J n=1 Tax=Pusillimonas sp. MFBS29 TaxID=2886690 RepID=UPI001D112ED7|nr:NADH-quinone oxidoreductase subunit J [Pusillimonas sp. MFBS29]MCC2595090.1 NADH-quinone oxidoreductase subunit J [Pusillimonas sp. MFBS29]